MLGLIYDGNETMKEWKDAEFVIADTNREILDALSERIGLFLWDAYYEVLDGLKNACLEMEGWIDRCGDRRGGFRMESEDGCGFGRCLMDFSNSGSAL